MVGNLAERAAEAIGADPLLTRVAAYYHDIGKLANPLAFIENQAGGENIHDQLEPEVSAEILKQHVADGIDLAYKAQAAQGAHRLHPAAPRDGDHELLLRHGAKERRRRRRIARRRPKAADVDERRFRHAGPKPQTREAALIMLADGVEASVRSLASRDEPAIRAMVDRIIDERIDDGQFDECDLTLRDLERIREAFVEQLLGHVPPRGSPTRRTRSSSSSRGGRAGGGGRTRRRTGAGVVTRGRSTLGRVADRRHRPATASRLAGPGRARWPARSWRAALDGRRRAAAGLDRADPVRRRRAGGAQRRRTWARTGPTDVLSFPLLPPEAFPPHPGRGAAVPRRSPTAPSRCRPGRRPHLGDIVVSVERAIEQAERAAAARPATSAGRRPTSCACS